MTFGGHAYRSGSHAPFILSHPVFITAPIQEISVNPRIVTTKFVIFCVVI